MAVSYFDDKSMKPDIKMISVALADSYPIWEEFRNHIISEYPRITEDWKHYGKAAGWSCKLISTKRNLIFFVPLDGSFRVRLVFGNKAVDCIEAASVPEDIKKTQGFSATTTHGLYARKPTSAGAKRRMSITLRLRLHSVKKLANCTAPSRMYMRR